jgi:hypothetical protein
MKYVVEQQFFVADPFATKIIINSNKNYKQLQQQKLCVCNILKNI